MNDWSLYKWVLACAAEVLRAHPELPFELAADPAGEIPSPGATGSRPIQLNGQGTPTPVALLGEIRFPDLFSAPAPDDPDFVASVRAQAQAAGAPYFFTWTLNDLLLWETAQGDRSAPLAYPIAAVYDRAQIANHRTSLCAGLAAFLTDFAGYYAERRPLPCLLPPEAFVVMLARHLRDLAGHVKIQLVERYFSDPAFQASVDYWMGAAQGWALGEKRAREADLERAAKLSAYLLVSHLVFYQALRRWFRLPPLRVLATADPVADLRPAISKCLEAGRKLPPPYGWVFGAAIEENMPVSSEDLVFSGARVLGPLRNTLHRIESMDFMKLDAAGVHAILRALSDPARRVEYGAPGMAPAVADVIQAFCIRESDHRVLNLGGDGTFLVRALARKQFLDTHRSVAALLDDLYGLDLSPYVLQLSAASLVAQTLPFLAAAEGEPGSRIGPTLLHADFFDLFPHSPSGAAPSLPGDLDAIVGVLPAVPRDLSTENGKVYRALLIDALKHGVTLPIRASQTGVPAKGPDVARHTDSCLYFLIHSLAFLRDGGYLGFLAPGSWLDVEYGADLQKFILDNFRIIAILESSAESWTPAKDPRAVITILCKEPDAARREKHPVKFVRLKAPLGRVLNAEAGDHDLAQAAALIRRIESDGEARHEASWLQWYTVRQHDLLAEGVDRVVAQAPAASGPARYIGGKWGRYLRAPDVFFRILDRSRSRLCRLKDCADLRRGFTTGANDFFFLRDLTDELPDEELRSLYQLRRIRTDRGPRVIDTARLSKAELRVVRSAQGSVHVIESEYLHPAVKSPRELSFLRTDANPLRTWLLLVHADKAALKGKHVLEYIKYGERRGYHRRPTCAARERWYDLGQMQPAEFLVLKSYNDRLMVLENGAVFNSDRFYAVNWRDDGRAAFSVPAARPAFVAAWLNSSWSLLLLELYGRADPESGGLDLMAYEASLLPILQREAWPDAAASSDSAAAALQAAYEQLARRPVLPIFEELVLPDRHKLDDAVLTLLGFTAPAERREVRDELYRALRRLVQFRLELAEEADARADSKYRKMDVAALAADLWMALDKTGWRSFPDHFVPEGAGAVEILHLPCGTVTVEANLFERGLVRVSEQIYDLGSVSRAEFVRVAATLYRGPEPIPIQVPHDPRVCAQALDAYRQYAAGLAREFLAAAESQAADPRLQKRLVRELNRLREIYLSCLPSPPSIQAGLLSQHARGSGIGS